MQSTRLLKMLKFDYNMYTKIMQKQKYVQFGKPARIIT